MIAVLCQSFLFTLQYLIKITLQYFGFTFNILIVIFKIFLCCQTPTVQHAMLHFGGFGGGDAALGVSLGQTAAGADLGGSSKYSVKTPQLPLTTSI